MDLLCLLWILYVSVRERERDGRWERERERMFGSHSWVAELITFIYSHIITHQETLIVINTPAL